MGADARTTAPRHGSFGGRLVAMGVLLLAGGTALLAVPSLGRVRADLDSISAWWGLLAVALEIASCASFVIVFRGFFDRLPPDLARSVAWVEQASGALLPGGGVASYAVGGVILGRQGMTLREIVVRSGGLFWFTSAINAFTLVLGTALVIVHPAGTGIIAVLVPLAIAAPLTGIIAAAPLLARRWRWASGRSRGLVEGVAEAWRFAGRRNWRALGALGYLFFDIAVLAALFAGLGYAVPAGALILGYLVGYLGTMIPIPGGIGVLEGGLSGALILYGTPPVKTVAVVLVYHAIAFWIPSLGGAVGYATLLGIRKRGRLAGPSAAPQVLRAAAPAGMALARRMTTEAELRVKAEDARSRAGGRTPTPCR